MKNLLIYGGAFNPPTIAHQKVIENAYNYAHTHNLQLVVLPSGDRSDKKIGLLEEQRLALIEAALIDANINIDKTIVDTRELRSTAPTETIDTIRSFHRTHPHAKQTWIFGSDSYQSIHSWREGNLIKQLVDILVVSRPGQPTVTQESYWLALNSHASSTLVRQSLQSQSPVDHLVGETVHVLLKEYGVIYT